MTTGFSDNNRLLEERLRLLVFGLNESVSSKWSSYNHTPQALPYPSRYPSLVRFHELFLQFHGYASILVCMFGVITNVMNISVLALKDMRTPTNNFLISLAVSDIFTMLPYIPFSFHFYCPVADPASNPEAFSYGWILFMLITIQVMATTHAISIWLAVSLAAFRYSQIRAPCPRGPLARERRIRHVKLTVACVCVLSVVVLIPNYMAHKIARYNISMNNGSYYGIASIEIGSQDPVVLTNICVYAILTKIVPCILIFVFSGSLLYHMGIKTTRRRHRLSVAIQQAKTTRMLLVVLVLFICAELPQGILFLLSATVTDFYDDVLFPLGELTDFVSLLNNAINFVFYCTMSQQFRDNFHTLYTSRFCWRQRLSLQPSASELLVLREQVPKTTTTTTHFQEDGQTTIKL